jgi:predicted secreted protein
MNRMLAIVGRWYSRRIINVNVNIIAAGLLALLPVLACVKLMEHFLATPAAADREILQTHHKLIISATTFLSDVIFDVVIYYFLHWMANHAPLLNKHRQEQIDAIADAAVESSPFFRDATRVQIQRAVLSPLLYLLWLGTQFIMMQVYGFGVGWSTVGGFVIGVSVARTLHTYWMLKEERARNAAIAMGRLEKMPEERRKASTHPIWEAMPAKSPAVTRKPSLNGTHAPAQAEPKPEAPVKSGGSERSNG